MIYSNKKKMYEVTARKGSSIETYPVGASNSEEAQGIVMGREGIKRRDILEVN